MGSFMLSKRLIGCFDVRDGKLAKSIKFVDTKDIGDPLDLAEKYYQEGIDELVFYDITASSDKRDIMIDVVAAVANEIFIPFSVGGGIRNVEDMRRVLMAGAEKINVNSAAIRNPKIIQEGAEAFGNQCVVLSTDIIARPGDNRFPSGYEIIIDGGRTPTGKDALEWVLEGEKLGAGEIVVNAIDTDGTQDGYNIELTRMISENVKIPVIASGGAGNPEHIYEVLTEGKADAALVASIIHYDKYTIREIKEYLMNKGIDIRKTWDE